MNREIVEYTLIAQNLSDHEKFIGFVNQYIKEGWQPLGVLQVAGFSGYGTICVQAMVKYKSE